MLAQSCIGTPARIADIAEYSSQVTERFLRYTTKNNCNLYKEKIPAKVNGPPDMSFRGLEVVICLDGLIFMFQYETTNNCDFTPWFSRDFFRRSDLIILSMTQTAFVLDHEEYVVVTQGSNNDGVSGLKDDDDA